MVKSGHASPVTRFGFSNPERPRLGVEVLDFATLRRRSPPDMLAAVHRTDFHQLFLFTGGTGTMTVDFVDHPVAAGTLLYICPGRVLRLPRPSTVDALMVLYTESFPPQLPALLDPFSPISWTVPDHSLRRAVLELKSEYRRAVAEPESVITVELLRQLLGALLGTGHHCRGLRPRPLERLLDLGTDRVGQLGRLVASLLQQPVRARLCLADLGGRMPLRLRLGLTSFVAGRVEDLGALALALLAIPLDLVLSLLELALASADLFLGAADLGRGCRLRVALDRVGHVGGGADHVQRVHPYGVAGRLDLAAASGRLKDAQLDLELRCVTPEGLERLLDALRLVTAVRKGRQLLDARKRRQRCLLSSFAGHQFGKYGDCIGGRAISD